MAKTLDFIHLDAAGAEKVVKGLAQLLADFQVYYTNLRGFHWEIKGHGFFTLHSKFEEFYNDAAEKVDELAERILMLGGTPENKFSEYLKIAKIKEISGVTYGEEAVKSILDTYSYLIKEERTLLATASEYGDEATVNLLSDYLQEQEKTVWMLVAFLSGSHGQK
ncbi:Dps family protein [Parabacteroides sp. Marseille-P3160]|uniref:Dps family protein n=1 Tax=Parabacteroides sp. Marseille-P3160 TaxID=1917887 RepID=UPI0009BB466A|nr:Dps family protein [Parabacteroides sp. Marseille-P3160]